MMRLRLLLPLETVLDVEVSKVVAEATDGWFCLLPQHVDTVTTLVPGVLLHADEAGRESFIAIDDAVLVKCGEQVVVATSRAVSGVELGHLRTTVQERFRRRDDREEATRAAARKLEATFLRGLQELEGVGS